MTGDVRAEHWSRRHQNSAIGGGHRARKATACARKRDTACQLKEGKPRGRRKEDSTFGQYKQARPRPRPSRTRNQSPGWKVWEGQLTALGQDMGSAVPVMSGRHPRLVGKKRGERRPRLDRFSERVRGDGSIRGAHGHEEGSGGESRAGRSR